MALLTAMAQTWERARRIIGWSSSRGCLDEARDRGRLRHVNGVTGCYLGDGSARSLGHRPLRGRRDHLVFGCNEVPGRLGTPCGLADSPGQGVVAPGDLRVSHKCGLTCRQVAGERGVELVAIQKQEAIPWRQDRRYRSTWRRVGDKSVN